MAWVEVLKASSEDEARAVTPAIADIPAGNEVQINIDLPAWLPVGKLADLAGVELLAQHFWADKLYPEMQVTDVEGNWNYIIIRGKAIGLVPLAVFLIIWAVIKIPVIISLIGAAAGFITVTIFGNITEQQKVAAELELAKIQATERIIDIYVAEGKEPPPLGDITDWLAGIRTPPPEAADIVDQFKTALPAIGIGTAGIIIVVLLALFLLGRR